MNPQRRSWTGLLVTMGLMVIGAQFTFAAVQGNHGLFQRIQIEAERDALAAELTRLEAQVAEMDVLTRRMSDEYLDLDLLDEMARSVLGRMRPDEIVLP